MKTKLRILVLEDEQAAGEKLVKMIRQQAPEAEIEWLRTVKSGVNYLQSDHPLDLIFSDIQLLDGSALRIYEEVAPSCPIIFCTAFDTFYVEAFQTNGIAYLLKPISSAEFEAAWQKFHLLFQTNAVGNIDPILLQQLAKLIQSESRPAKKTFTVKKAQGVYLLQTADIVYLQAQGDFVLAFDQKGKKHVLNYSLQNLEAILDSHLFFRINRGELVHFLFIQQFEPYVKNRLAIRLGSISETLYTSNSRSAAFREWLEKH